VNGGKGDVNLLLLRHHPPPELVILSFGGGILPSTIARFSSEMRGGGNTSISRSFSTKQRRRI
jgi:hypothetical protein